MNGTGAIVGFYDNGSGRHGFIDMGGTFTTFDDPARQSGNTTVYSNNNSEQIVGNYLSNGYQGFVATPVPLNSSVTVPPARSGSHVGLGAVSYASSTGTLKIETSSSFTGTIAGQLATTDVIDLADVSYAVCRRQPIPATTPPARSRSATAPIPLISRSRATTPYPRSRPRTTATAART